MSDEDVRREVLRWLAARPGCAFPAVKVRQWLAREGFADVTDQQTVAACLFLAGFNPPLLNEVTDPLGSTKAYSATSAGILHNERNP